MFSTRDLAARANKLEAEQKARTERERQRAEKERSLQERARQRELEREDAARQRKLEELAAAEAQRERVYVETEQNRGVYLREELAAVPADEAALLAKGIKRSKDKILLPPSVGAALIAQDASKNGAMLFELALPGGGPASARTHAGVLEFSAPEGTVVLPRKVVQSLWGSLDAVASGAVVVTYRRLEKASYVRLQPMCHGFHELVGDLGMREVLEATLMGHSTLTEGDWVAVQLEGQEVPLRVQELRPASAVSIIDTDVEADVVPSLEAEQYLSRYEEEQRRQAARLAALAAQQAELAAQQAALEQEEQQRQQQLAQAAAEEAAAHAEADAARRERSRALKAAALPLEPPAGAPQPHATCLFRMPDGGRASRRFTLQQPLQALFDFVDSVGAGGLEPGSYQLVTRFPRRVVGCEDAEAGRLLADAGVAAGAQEAFFVEPLAAEAEAEPMQLA